MKLLRYIIYISVLLIGCSAFAAPTHTTAADTIANLQDENVIAKKLTDYVNTQLVLTDRQYRRVYELMFKEAVLINQNLPDSVIQEVKKERDVKMKRILKQYQYNLYLKIRNSLYDILKEPEKNEEPKDSESTEN